MSIDMFTNEDNAEFRIVKRGKSFHLQQWQNYQSTMARLNAWQWRYIGTPKSEYQQVVDQMDEIVKEGRRDSNEVVVEQFDKRGLSMRDDQMIHVGDIFGVYRLIVVEGGSWKVWEPNPNLKMSPGEQLDAVIDANPSFSIATFKRH